MVLIDLQKAFDTIDRGILLDKMICLRFSNSRVAWFNSYVTHRSFIVNVSKEYSSPGTLSCGVLQGSVLGPLLFHRLSIPSYYYMQKTLALYTWGKDTKTIEEQLNRDFNFLCEWFIDNKVSIHFGKEKTKSILFETKRHLKN